LILIHQLTILQKHHLQLQSHLFPGDGLEAVAILLCQQSTSDLHVGLLVKEVFTIPYSACLVREPDFVHWRTSTIREKIMEAAEAGLSIVKVHCHPGGGSFFSDTDDNSDRLLFPSLYGWIDNSGPHASIVALPDEEYIGRVVTEENEFISLDKIKVVGSEIVLHGSAADTSSSFDLRNQQAFGAATIQALRQMRVAIIGCSGTGGPTAMMLARLGVGELYLIDPDRIEQHNLNRIPCTKESDIGKLKTDVLRRELGQCGSGTIIHSCPVNLYDDIKLIRRVAGCDAIFGCVDSIDGRHLINSIATYYLIPYIDIGVKLVADGEGGLDHICATVHFLRPGQSLMARNVYTPDDLAAAGLYRTIPEEYERQQKEGYIRNVNVASPAVITVNNRAASIAVDELLARVHNYRKGYNTNESFEIQRWDLVSDYHGHVEDRSSDPLFLKGVGKGDIIPLLNMPEIDKLLVVC
jgi:hypothetical protein